MIWVNRYRYDLNQQLNQHYVIHMYIFLYYKYISIKTIAQLYIFINKEIIVIFSILSQESINFAKISRIKYLNWSF